MGKLIDLDEYRSRRVKEGTWPPDESTVREYWAARRRKPEPKAPPKGKPGKNA